MTQPATSSTAKPLAGKTALVTGSTSGIGLGIATALANASANLVLNGFGDVNGALAQIEATGVRRRPSQRRHDQAGRNRSDDRLSQGELRRHRRARQQRGHPARRDHRRIPGRALGRHYHDQPQFGVSHHASRAADHARGRLGTRDQHRICAWAGGLGRQVGLCGGARERPDRRHGERDLPGLRAYAARAEASRSTPSPNAIPSATTPRAKLLGEKQPSEQFVTTKQIGELALFLCSDAASEMRGAELKIDGAWSAQ